MQKLLRKCIPKSTVQTIKRSTDQWCPWHQRQWFPPQSNSCLLWVAQLLCRDQRGRHLVHYNCTM